MRAETISDVNPRQLAAVVGESAFVKAVKAAQQEAVQHIEWDGSGHVLYALVKGTGRRCEISAYLRVTGGRPAYVVSRCGCRVPRTASRCAPPPLRVPARGVRVASVVC